MIKSEIEILKKSLFELGNEEIENIYPYLMRILSFQNP